MKTETRLYSDGTEPDVIRRWCCDGLCKQGRDCPEAPPPAEACTEIGTDDGLEAVGSVVIVAVAAIAIVAIVALVVGVFF